MAQILLAGDTCPVGRNLDLFENGNASALLNDLLPEFEAADLRIVNLEGPMIREEKPIQKCGPVLGSPDSCVNGLKAMGIDVVGLANNHIMDHGLQGLQTTITTLDKHGIAHMGAGEDLHEARTILVREASGVRTGILAVAEREFAIAERTAPGANPLDIIDAVRNIKEHRSDFDYLIILVHGGNETYPYPRPGLMDTCRFFVEQGAHAVICQHSHCAGCMETYRGAPIVYGQGNFLFDYPSQDDAWCEGLLICLGTSERGMFKIRLVPYRQSDGQPGARRMTADDEERFVNDFTARSEAISDDSFVARQWDTFCRENKRYYLHGLHGRPGFVRRLAGRLDLLHYLDSPDVQRMRLNMIRCGSHREALETILELESRRSKNKTRDTILPVDRRTA